MSKRHFVLSHFSSVLLAVAMTAQTSNQFHDDHSASAATKQPRGPIAANDDPAYVIGADDVLNVSVWKEPDVSGTFPVRPDGKISLPLVSDIQAAGHTPMELSSVIKDALAKYLSDPRVTVIVTATNSRRFYLLGEVLRGGVFPLSSRMTVLQAVSMGGGFSQFAAPQRAYVLRSENGKQIKYPFDYKAVMKGKKAEQNIELKAGDTIVVP